MSELEWKLEVIVVPVADVDRAKEFYSDRAGFNLDVDHQDGDFRVVQLTPHGSACSIALMPNPDAAGTLNGLQVTVADIEAARAELVGRGAEPSDLFHFVHGVQTPGPHPEREKFGTFFALTDPDGNGWLIQEA